MKKPIRLKSSTSYLINFAVIAVLFVVGNMIYTGGLDRVTKALVIQCGFYAMLAVSLNVSAGYLGQLPLGHAGFMAVGAYTAGIFWGATSDWPRLLTIIVGVILAGAVAAVFGILIGIPALRLKGDYLAIITLGFGEIIRIIIVNLKSITGGTPGLIGIPKYSDFKLTFICLVLTCYIIRVIMNSRHGRCILAIRDNEIAADCCGVNLTFYKVFAFAVSAFFAGVAGAVYAGYQGSLFPTAFNFDQSINILVMVVLGGMGSMTGSILAAIVLTVLPALMQGLSAYRMVVYSILLIVVMIFRPSGLMGRNDFSLKGLIEGALNGTLFRKKKPEKAAETEKGGESCGK